MKEDKEYTIYYVGECGEIKESGIIAHNVLPVVIPVKNITLADGFICRTDSISSIVITLDVQPTGLIQKAILMNEDNETYSINVQLVALL